MEPDERPNRALERGAMGCVLVALAILGVFVVISAKSPDPAPTSAQVQATTASTAAEAAPETVKAKEPSSAWSYDTKEDEMGGGTIRYAKVVSTNTVSFDFPYQGAQRATLTLRIHPRYGKDAILQVVRGQFNVGVEGCDVLLRFDDGKPIRRFANGPADNSTTTLFIQDFAGILGRIRKGKTLKVEAPFYQEGRQVFEFDVAGLDWP